MQKRTDIQASSLIIMLSMITILIQFVAYYLFDISLTIWGIACVISIVCCHIILEQTSTYTACFQYSLLTIFISLVINVITYYGDVKTFLPFTSIMIGITLINWLIPMLHCLFRFMLDYGTRIEEFRGFYRNINILFLLFYIVVIIYGNFVKGAFPWAYQTITSSANFSPFEVTASQIENYLYATIPMKDIIIYLASRILTYIPYGFFIAQTLRSQNRLTRFFALLFMPLLIEMIQYFVIPGRCDIDDLIYALLGGLLGSFLFFLTNIIFRAISGRNFLAGETGYRYHSLHF